jgi:hypothetical protein
MHVQAGQGQKPWEEGKLLKAAVFVASEAAVCYCQTCSLLLLIISCMTDMLPAIAHQQTCCLQWFFTPVQPPSVQQMVQTTM